LLPAIQRSKAKRDWGALWDKRCGHFTSQPEIGNESRKRPRVEDIDRTAGGKTGECQKLRPDPLAFLAVICYSAE
jgi:hypothetical protein